jgi:hypothetical protein
MPQRLDNGTLFFSGTFFYAFFSNKMNRQKQQNMEKNQHNSSAEKPYRKSNSDDGSQRPGQQLPAGLNAAAANEQEGAGETEQHSESSFPQQEGETLGTP